MPEKPIVVDSTKVIIASRRIPIIKEDANLHQDSANLDSLNVSA
jgi:hypothetical protein